MAVCVAFDLQGPTFRHLRYDGYKATRHGMPEELAQQMPLMKEVLRAMNIPIYGVPGLGGRRRHRHRGQAVRPGGLGLRGGHRGPGQPAADRRPCAR